MLENQTAQDDTIVIDQEVPTTTKEKKPSFLDKLKAKFKKEDSKPKAQSSKLKKWHKILIAVALVLLLLGSVIGVIGFYTYSVVSTLKLQANEAKFIAQNMYTNFKNQDLPASEAELKNLNTKFFEIKDTYAKLSFYNNIPFANKYYQDGTHAINAAEAGLSAGLKSLEAITPYADVLGFTGEGTFEGGSAENRLKLVLETLDKVTPQLDAIENDLKTVESELAYIDENRYPETLQGTEVKSRITQVKSLSQGAVEGITQYRPIIEQLPDIMGARGERKKYLILFTNNGELRATGGFLTAYSVIFIEDGVVTPEKSDDIYEIDKKLRNKPEIPEQLGRYLTTETKWNLRDMNISPDFKTSMDQFYEYYSTIGSEPQDIDGIIAINTNFLTGLLDILGPVEVAGYGTFSSQVEEGKYKGLPQVVYALSEIITRPTPYMREDRKGILGPMMKATLTKAYAAPKQQWPMLFGFGIEELEARDIQLYFLDENLQTAAEAINAAGRLPEGNDQDFLAIVNSNLGGAKSNFFINYDVEQEISAPENGMIEKKVTITYKNRATGDNCNLEAGLLCLNATNRDWTRLYVPNGSQLVDAQGFNSEAQVYDEAGYTIIEGFFTLEPNSQAKLILTYQVPYTDSEVYKVNLWKQGGVDAFETTFFVTGGEGKVLVNKDTYYEEEF